VVSSDRLIEELWPGQPADRAADSLQVRLWQLRKAFRSVGEAGRLATQPPGYLLRVAAEELDALRFERLAAEGNAALGSGDAATAARRLDEALREWRGPALADVDTVPFARAEASRLEEERLAALESRAEALLACGRHRELIAELDTLTTAHPLRERFWFQRMLALYRVGRQAEALRAYRDLRAILVAELAIEPSPDLRELERRILRQDRVLDGPAPGRTPAGRAGEDSVPRTRDALTEDGIRVAYQVIGEGECDILFVPGLMSHLELLWEDHETADFFRRLAQLGRLILFDKRDTGLRARRHVARGADGGRAGCDARGRLEPGRAVRLLRRRADEHPVRSHLPSARQCADSRIGFGSLVPVARLPLRARGAADVRRAG
jgi:DNA-binding SARP family transcriptional activator